MGYQNNIFGGSTAGVTGRVGDNSSDSGDSLGLFLKKFAGEVMTVFDQKNIMKPLHTIRTITKGRSAQFPIIGTAEAGYYTPGNDILGEAVSGGGVNKFKQTETLIHIDKVLMSTTFIASVDELVSHYDVRAPYSHQLGESLANTFDKNVLQVAIKTGCKQAAYTQDGIGVADDSPASPANLKLGIIPASPWIDNQTQYGSVVYSKASAQTTNAEIKRDTAAAGANTNSLRATPTASVIKNALFESARLLDEKDVPASDRYAIITPAMYYELINSDNIITGSVINRDIGGEGSIAAGTITRIAGISLLVSNHLPKTDRVGTENRWEGNTAAGAGNDYNLDYRHVAGLVFQKGGFGTLKLMDLSMESEYLIQRQGNLFVAKYSMGHGPLRPESVVVWSDGTQPASFADTDATS